jgi:hypothetical protein
MYGMLCVILNDLSEKLITFCSNKEFQKPPKTSQPAI